MTFNGIFPLLDNGFIKYFPIRDFNDFTILLDFMNCISSQFKHAHGVLNKDRKLILTSKDFLSLINLNHPFGIHES